MLFEYSVDDCVGSRDGKSVYPMIVTPSTSTSSPGTVASQLPPPSAARSTMTEPCLIADTISLVISLGDGFPGI